MFVKVHRYHCNAFYNIKMRKIKFEKIVHLIVASVLLASTIGVVINKHYSGGELFSTALFVEAESCCETSCCHSLPMEGCREEFEYHKLDVDFTIPDNSTSLHSITLDISLFLINAEFTNNLYSDAIQNNFALRDRKPPPKITDLTVLFHSFLI